MKSRITRNCIPGCVWGGSGGGVGGKCIFALRENAFRDTKCISHKNEKATYNGLQYMAYTYVVLITLLVSGAKTTLPDPLDYRWGVGGYWARWLGRLGEW